MAHETKELEGGSKQVVSSLKLNPDWELEIKLSGRPPSSISGSVQDHHVSAYALFKACVVDCCSDKPLDEIPLYLAEVIDRSNR